MKVRYIKSAKVAADYPFPYKPEVAIVGRSNAGKSSFINALVGQKIAKVSGTPGKTRLLNFFEFDESIYMVDMPGYGFAKGDVKEVESWKTMIEDYLRERKSLKGVLLIMDIRREWSADEEMLREWLDHHGKKWGVILNKADKLTQSQIMQKAKSFARDLGDVPIFILSSLKKRGLNDVKNLVFKEWPK